MRTLLFLFFVLILVGCATPQESLPMEKVTPVVEQQPAPPIVEQTPIEEVKEVTPPVVEEEKPVQSSPVIEEKYSYVPPVLNEPIVFKEGDFRPIQKSVTGTARWLNHNGNRSLQLYSFRIDNGPKLHVYLSPHPNPSHKSELGEFYDVGALESYFGTQVFDLPDDLSPQHYDSAVIYSESFGVVYATAPLKKP